MATNELSTSADAQCTSTSSLAHLDIDAITLPQIDEVSSEDEEQDNQIEKKEPQKKIIEKWDWNADFIPLYGPIPSSSFPSTQIESPKKSSPSGSSNTSENDQEEESPTSLKHATQV